ncbi:hypothetical protein LZ30DRAFT_723931 [Colletotrichum cereale]|nr:hypothetical protein LZ30DRAFT_723931 [Colletotrichum cereale]
MTVLYDRAILLTTVCLISNSPVLTFPGCCYNFHSRSTMDFLLEQDDSFEDLHFNFGSLEPLTADTSRDSAYILNDSSDYLQLNENAVDGSSSIVSGPNATT